MLIAAIFPAVHSDCQSIIWPGIMDYADRNEIDLITFIPTSQKKMATFDPHYSIVQKLIQNLKLDGLIIYTGAFSDYFDNNALKIYCNSLNSCPMICISRKVEGIKTILINNTTGIRETVQHLVKTHGAKTFAFVKGHCNHTESEDRFKAFTDELKVQELAIDPELVFYGQFSKESGASAAREILAMNKLPDAVLAVNDSTALGIINEFTKNHIRVPGDIYVVGFDDVPEAVNNVPSLTTVRQPLYTIGQLAIKSLFQFKNTKNSSLFPSEDVFVTTKFIPRQSCGCVQEQMEDSGLTRKTLNKQKNKPIKSRKQFVEFCTEMIVEDCPEIEPAIARQWIEELFNCFKKDIQKYDKEAAPKRFIDKLVSILVYHISATGSATVWKDILIIFSTRWKNWRHTVEESPLIEDIINHSGMIINDFILRIRLNDELQKDEKRTLIRNTMLSLITAFNIEKILNVLMVNLPTIGITECHMVIYGNTLEGISIENLEIPETSQLVLSFNERKTLVDIGTTMRFETKSILPDSVWNTDSKKNYLLFPIVFEQRNYGYIIFQRAPGLPLYVYEELHIHIGNGLHGHNLVNELREMSLRDELTGLYNRRGFTYLGNHLLSQARRTGTSVCLMYGDINKLKPINDNYGHSEGDFTISKTAELLHINIREQDIVARIGGDEFTIIAIDLDEKGCSEILNRIQSAFKSFNNQKLRPYEISISIGHIHKENPGNLSMDELLDIADNMLREIKQEKNTSNNAYQNIN